MAENNRTEENKAINERIARNRKRFQRKGKHLTFKTTNTVREFSDDGLGDEFQRATIVGPNYPIPVRNWNTAVSAGITRKAPGTRASTIPLLAPNSTRRNNEWSREYSRRYATAKNEVRRGINARRLANSPNAAFVQAIRNRNAARETNSLTHFVSQPTVTPNVSRPVRPQSASPARSALGAAGRAALSAGPKISLGATPSLQARAAAAHGTRRKNRRSY